MAGSDRRAAGSVELDLSLVDCLSLAFKLSDVKSVFLYSSMGLMILEIGNVSNQFLSWLVHLQQLLLCGSG